MNLAQADPDVIDVGDALMPINTRPAALDSPSTASSLAVIDAFRAAVDAMDDPSHLKNARDYAAAVEHALDLRGAAHDRQNDWAEIKLRAERKLGAWLAAHVRAGNPQLSGTAAISRRLPAGVTRTQSWNWQREAKVPAAAFELYVTETREAGGELTSAGLLARVEEPLFGRARLAGAKKPTGDDLQRVWDEHVAEALGHGEEPTIAQLRDDGRESDEEPDDTVPCTACGGTGRVACDGGVR